MSFYSDTSVKELKLLLRNRGLSDKSRKKGYLIKQLQDDDLLQSQLTEDNNAASEVDEDDVILTPVVQTAELKLDDSTAAQMRMLELQLQIEQAKLK